jgi:ABC-type branched-subunit amino acid transport system substrate-binding protein
MQKLKKCISVLFLWCALPILTHAELPIKIGVSTPLTGPAATCGTAIKNLLMFATQRLFGGRYQLIIEDDKCSGKKTITD